MRRKGVRRKGVRKKEEGEEREERGRRRREGRERKERERGEVLTVVAKVHHTAIRVGKHQQLCDLIWRRKGERRQLYWKVCTGGSSPEGLLVGRNSVAGVEVMVSSLPQQKVTLRENSFTRPPRQPTQQSREPPDREQS